MTFPTKLTCYDIIPAKNLRPIPPTDRPDGLVLCRVTWVYESQFAERRCVKIEVQP